MNEPQYKIYGSERRKLKKQLSLLKSFLKNFWHHHQVDKDMASFYGGSDTFPMSDEDAKLMYDNKKEDIQELESRLSVEFNIN